MIHSREDLHLAQRIVIKAGTSIVSTPDGYPSLSRMANIVEYAAKLVRAGKEVIIVTSGAVGVGRQRLQRQALLKQSLSDVMLQRSSQSSSAVPSQNSKVSYNSACAAAGQLGLMSLYETMFNQYDIITSQLLLTAFDFTSPERRKNVQYVISQLLCLGIVPLLNENDAVSANQGYQLFGNTFSDNDSLAALVSIELNAHLLILLTDVHGVYNLPPSDPEAKLIDIYDYSMDVKIGDKSTQGRGGMGAKVDAALRGIDGGIQAVIIADGRQVGIIEDILSGKKGIGTLFLRKKFADESIAVNVPVPSESQVVVDSVESRKLQKLESSEMAKLARIGSRQLLQLSSDERSQILYTIANELLSRQDEILSLNELDVSIAEKSGKVSSSNLKRLKLTAAKIQTLSEGLRSIARADEPIGQLLSQTEIADGLILDKVTSPIGVLLVIFESRPDCLPQIAALAIRSGNGLLLKGGKEAENSNAILYSIISDCIEKSSQFKVSRAVIGLITSRADIPSLLTMDKYIDLVIPRGSSDLVKYIKDNTRIPVLGHAEGICHVFIDKDCDLKKATRISVDSKTDYPAACNALETLLLHSELVSNGFADKILRELRLHGVTVLGGPTAKALGLTDLETNDFRREYGDLTLAVEVVDSVNDAISHILTYGSGHTECIVTESVSTAEAFIAGVDSACVFHNASTRFADGFRFGLGAEVGISTGRIHARGPVGVEGLLTSKWIIRSLHELGHTVASFNEPDNNAFVYTHKKLKF